MGTFLIGIIANTTTTHWTDVGAERMKFFIFLILQLVGYFIALIIDPKRAARLLQLTLDKFSL